MKIFVSFIFFFLSFTTLSFCQEDSEVRDIINKYGEAKILVKADKEDLDTLSKITSIDRKIQNEYLVYVNNKQFNQFLTLGLDYKPFPEEQNPKALHIANTVEQMKTWEYYPSYQVYLDLMQSFAQDFPEICRLDTIGVSHNNRLILSLKINSDNNTHKPKFFYSSTMHGDELTGYVILLRLADYILNAHQEDDYIEDLLSKVEIYICPLANPDGVYAGGDNNVSHSTRYNANYVDLNRNFPNPILGQHPDGEEHQIETLSFMQYALQEDFDVSINIHTGAEVCNYPWDCWNSHQSIHPDKNWFINICEEFVNTARHSAGNNYFTDVSSNGIILGGDWYKIYGSRQDWQTWYTKAREITLEVSTQKTPPSNSLPNYWNYLKDGLIGFIDNSLVGVEGLIKDITNNQAINSATIEVENLDNENSITYSNSEGYYFRPLLAGNYNIKIHAENYQDTIFTISITDNSTLLKDIYLTPSLTSTHDLSTTKDKILIYPNPCKDKLHINIDEPVYYSISDIQSHTFLSGSIDKNTKTIDLTSLKEGVYIISLYFNKKNQRNIFIKQ